jgi:single stranded DNA-binding protein
MLNRVTLIGTLGDEIRFREGRTPQARASLGTVELWDDPQGEPREHIEWHLLTVWGQMAVSFATLQKGDRVYVEGRLRYRELRKDGKRFRRTEVRVDSYRELDGRTFPEVPSAGSFGEINLN